MKQMYNPMMFQYPEGLDMSKYIVATYYMRGKGKNQMELDLAKFAEAIAAEQATGTWVDVPFETAEIIERHAAKVLGIYEVPAYDRELPDDIQYRDIIVRMAYPWENIGTNFPMIFTTAIGNIAAARLKLVDLEFPEEYTKHFKGAKFGIDGVRKLLDVPERPLTCAMIKPDTGWSPEQGYTMAYEAYAGGIDVIKDDELLVADPAWCPIEQRVKKIVEAGKRAYEETGEKKLYTTNLTDDSFKIRDNAYRALDAGANALMINTYTAGFSALRQLAEDPNIQVPIMSHPDFAAGMAYAPDTGVSIALLWGKLLRLAGADMAITTNYYGKIPVLRDSYLRTCRELKQKFHHFKTCMPAPSGGLYQGVVPTTIYEVGTDVMISAGGAVHGHRNGATAGARSLREAIDATMEGIPLREYAKDHPDLQVAIDDWGTGDREDLFAMKK